MIEHPFPIWQALKGRLYGHLLVYVLPNIFASCIQLDPLLQMRKLRAILSRHHISMVKLGDPRQCDSRAILFNRCLPYLHQRCCLNITWSRRDVQPMPPTLSFIITAIQLRRTKSQQACVCLSSFSIHSRVYTQ